MRREKGRRVVSQAVLHLTSLLYFHQRNEFTRYALCLQILPHVVIAERLSLDHHETFNLTCGFGLSP